MKKVDGWDVEDQFHIYCLHCGKVDQLVWGFCSDKCATAFFRELLKRLQRGIPDSALDSHMNPCEAYTYTVEPVDNRVLAERDRCDRCICQTCAWMEFERAKKKCKPPGICLSPTKCRFKVDDGKRRNEYDAPIQAVRDYFMRRSLGSRAFESEYMTMFIDTERTDREPW